MAIAIGSGLSPEKGLFTAIVGGFLISALGGSRFQIGGPAGAFIVLIASIVERQGYDGLVLATLMAGLMMMAAGFLRLGTYIKYIPFPVTVGFTAGIAVIIFASQVQGAARPRHGQRAGGAAAQAAGHLGEPRHDQAGDRRPVGCSPSAIIVGLRRVRPEVARPADRRRRRQRRLPALFQLDVATIGSHFGEVPRTLPAPALPPFDLAKMRAVLPDAVAIALLGAIESLLSAVVADGMSGRKHRSNCELVAQGAANIAAVTFGGMCVTGTIARTATNVRAGARSPVAGMLHAVYILLFMLVAAPLAAYIPLASLGGVLAVVAWNMAEKAGVRQPAARLVGRRDGAHGDLPPDDLRRSHRSPSASASRSAPSCSCIAWRRPSRSKAAARSLPRTRPTATGDDRTAYRPDAFDGDVAVYRISGAFFFGATAAVSGVLDRIGAHPKTFILDFADVPLVDSTAAKALEGFVHKLRHAGTDVYFTSARKNVRRTLLAAGLRKPLVRYASSIEDAVAMSQEGAADAA